MPQRKRLATLLPEENKAWETAFVYWKQKGYSDARADARAWIDVQMDFPRLKKFDGCRA